MRLGLPVGFGSERTLTKCNILQLTTRWSTSYTAFTNTASHLSKVTFYASPRLNNIQHAWDKTYILYITDSNSSQVRKRGRNWMMQQAFFSLLYSQWCEKCHWQEESVDSRSACVSLRFPPPNIIHFHQDWLMGVLHLGVTGDILEVRK